MTDVALIGKRLAFIETCLRELRDLADASRLPHDIRERRFVEHTLQLAIQAALDTASHIVSDERLGEPRTNRQLFDLLVQGDWLPADLLPRLDAMTGFRNVLVHGYTDVDLDVVADVLDHHLPDLEAFVGHVRQGLANRDKSGD